MDNYVCFYTTKPFWAGERPDIDFIISNSDLFTKTLSERVFIYENDKINLAICKDGLIMTQIKELESKREEIFSRDRSKEQFPPDIQFTAEYLNYINAIQLLLSSALLKEEKFDYFDNSFIRSGEAFTIYYENDEFRSSGVPRNITSYYYMGRYISQYNLSYPIQIDTRIVSRLEINENVFNTLFEDINRVIEDAEAIQILSQINSAISEYKNLNFRQALVQSWFVIEYFINKKWIDFLRSKQLKINEEFTRINNDRRNYLIGRDFTAAIMSNLLELNDLIPFELFKKIDNVRRQRNDAVHNSELVKKLADSMKTMPGPEKSNKISIDNCWDAFTVLMEFVKTEYQLELKIGGSISYSPL